MDRTATLDYFTTAQTVLKNMQGVKDLSGQTDTNVELKQVNSFAFCMSQNGKNVQKLAWGIGLQYNFLSFKNLMYTVIAVV